MEAITLGCRSVVQDKFFQKNQEDKFKKHQKTVQIINRQRLQSLKGNQKQIDSLASTLRKSKSAARVFKEKEEKSHLKQENMNLLKRIWHQNPSVKTFNSDRYQYVSGSNWNLHKKKLEQIKEENKLIGKKVLHQQPDLGDYKKRLKEEIKGYIDLRDSIRKHKFKEAKQKNSKSEKKIVAGVKLDKLKGSKADQKVEEENAKQRVKPNPQQKE